MSLDQPPQNKAIQTAPAKKEWHFPSDGIHLAESVIAETYAEALKIYNKVKKLIEAPSTPPAQTAPSQPAPPAAAKPAEEAPLQTDDK